MTSDLPHTHDGPVHLARMAAYYQALHDGQIFPRWASDLNYRYGMPLFNFIYHTPYLVASLFLAGGVGLVSTFKLVLAVSYLLAGIGIFLLGKELTGDDKKAMFIAVFYQFAPFRLVEMSVRGSFGEVYTYALLPFILFGIMRFIRSGSSISFVITTIATGLLILSHNSISLVFFLFALGFAMLQKATMKRKLWIIGALSLGLGVATFYWLPAVIEHKYTYGDLFMKDLYKTHFAPFINFLIPNLTNNVSLQTGGIDTQVGFFHVLALLFGMVAVIRKQKIATLGSQLIIYLLVVSAISFFFMEPISRIFWQSIPLLRQFQFPWRLLSVMIVTTSLLSVLYFPQAWFKKKIMYVSIITFVILSTIAFWRPPLGFDTGIDEAYYWNYPLNTTYFGETDLIWSAGQAKAYPKAQLEVIAGAGTLTNIKRRSTIHTATITAQTETRLVDNTQYFPGWRIYVDGQKVPIQFQDTLWRGLLTFTVPAGEHKVKVVFAKSKVQMAGEFISLTSMFLLFLLSTTIRSKRFI